MELFDKIGKKANQVYKTTTGKTSNFAKDTRIKMKIGILKSDVEEIYEEIGKKIYLLYALKGEGEIQDELIEYCIKIEKIVNEIDDLIEESLELKNIRKCKNCFTEIKKEYNYCYNCGYIQKEEKTDIEESKENQETKVEDTLIDSEQSNDVNNDKEKELLINDFE